MAAMGLGAWAVCAAPAGGPPPGWRIDFSLPPTLEEDVSTNLSRLSRKTERLPQGEQGGQKLLDFWRSGTSLDGLPPPPPQSPFILIPNRRLQGRLANQRGLSSMNKEELQELLLASPGAEEDLSKSGTRPDKEKRSRQGLEMSRSDREADLSEPDSRGNKNKDGETDPSASRKKDNKSEPSDQLDSRDDSEMPADLRETLKEFRQQRGDEVTADFLSTPSRANLGLSEMFGSRSQKASVFDNVAHNREALENFKRATEGKTALDKAIGPQFFTGPSLSLTPVANPLESPADSPGSLDLLQSRALRLSDLQGGGFDSPFSTTRLAPSSSFSDGKFAMPSTYLLEPPKFQAPQQPILPPPTPTFVFPKRAFQ